MFRVVFFITSLQLTITYTLSKYNTLLWKEIVKKKKYSKRYNWIQKWQQTDLGFTTNWVFQNETAFHINVKRSMTWTKKGTLAIVAIPKRKQIQHRF